MRVAYVLIFLGIFLFGSLHKLEAQNVADFQKDSLELEELISRIKNLSIQDSALFFQLVNQAEKDLKKHPYQFSEGNLLIAKSSFYFGKNDLKTARKYVDEAFDRFSKINNQQDKEWGMAKASMLKALLYGLNGNKVKEQETYLKIIPALEKYKDTITLNTVYGNLGLIFYDNGQFEKAKEYFLKSYHTQIDSKKDSRNLGNSALNLVMVSYQLGNPDDMLEYLEIAKSTLSQKKDTLQQWALYYNLKAEYNLAKGNFDASILDNRSALKVAEKYNEFTYKMNAVSGIAHAYYQKGDYRNSLYYLKQYYEDTKRYNYPQSTLSSLKNLADLEHKTGNPEQAYEYMLEYSDLKDSIDQKTIVQRLHTLEAEFQSAQKEKEIAQLQHDNEKKDWKLQQNKIWLFGSVGAMLILFVLAFLLYRNSKSQKKINQQDKDLHHYELSQLEHKHQIEMLSSLMQGAETERQRLGRDLHDGLGGLLSGIKLKLNTFFQNPSQEKGELQSELKSDLDNAITEMRFVSQSLLPDLLQNYGLSDALQQYCSRLSGEELKIDFQSVNVKECPDKEKQLMFYRIAQELINNAVKHADAKEIFVQLQQRDYQLFLTVEDDGVGFDEKLQSEGSGLANLKHRINYLKGSLEIATAKNKGTSVYVTCPV